MRRRMTFGTLLLALILCGADCALDEAKDVGFFDRAVREDNRRKLEDGTCSAGQHVATEAECAEIRKNEGAAINCAARCVPDK